MKKVGEEEDEEKAVAMAGLANIRKRLTLVTGDQLRAPDMADMSLDATASYKVSDEGTLNLLSRSQEYDINEEGLQFRKLPLGEAKDIAENREKNYRCASYEMCVFNAIGFGASSVVRKAIHIPTHRILALKKINVFEKDKRQQLLNEIRTLCEARRAHGLVEFYGAFYSPDSGQISIALEYMDGGSLADIVRTKKSIPEPILSLITRKVLQGLHFLHAERHMVHRDIKPANLLLNLNGEPKITDFGISAGLDNSIAMCATFVGTVTYMSPERINNQYYSFPADIWSLGLTLLECATGIFPYNANKGPVNLMLQVMEDPSPTPPADKFSPEFRDFVDSCLLKDSNQRPTAEQLLAHPFVLKYENTDVDLPSFVHSVFDPTERLKDLSDMLTVHYYMLFDGSDKLWEHMETFYTEKSTLTFSEQTYKGPEKIFATLTRIRDTLAGEQRGERIVHAVDNMECCAFGRRGLMIRVSGSLVIGQGFVPPGDGMPDGQDGNGSYDSQVRRMGSFKELFVTEPGEQLGSYRIINQDLHIHRRP